MPPVAIHHTDTVDTPWDGGANEARLSSPITGSVGKRVYGWYDANGNDPDGDGYPDAKADWSFPHHEVDADGTPGAANLNGCRNGLSRIPQSNIPTGDRSGVQSHLQAHLDDAQGTGAYHEIAAPRAYRHVLKALEERPWAIQPHMLAFMVDLVRGRVAGNVISHEEIAERLAAAKAQNGDRLGGSQEGSVAVIPMYGVLTQRASLMSDFSGGASIAELRTALRDAINDPSVKAVVFDVDSPGGSVDGITEFAAELRQMRQGAKPIVAQVNTIAASAAYWLAASMSEIVVTPSGEVGSIGVFAAHQDLSQAAAMAGVKTTLISAGEFKTEGNEFEPLTDEARSAIQDQVDTFYSMFLADVAKGRRVSVDAVATGYGQGRTLLAKKALAAGMVDGIDTLDATVARLQPTTVRARPAAAVIPIQPAAVAASKGSRPDVGWNQRMRKGAHR